MVAQCERATPRPEARRASSQACSCSSLPWRPLGAARRNPQPPSLRCAHGTDASRRARPPPGAPSGEHASPPPRARQPRARVRSAPPRVPARCTPPHVPRRARRHARRQATIHTIVPPPPSGRPRAPRHATQSASRLTESWLVGHQQGAGVSPFQKFFFFLAGDPLSPMRPMPRIQLSGPLPLSRERPQHDSKFYTKSGPPRLKW